MPRTTVHRFDDGKRKATVIVTSPDLTPEERKKRWAEIERTASLFVNRCIRNGSITIDYFSDEGGDYHEQANKEKTQEIGDNKSYSPNAPEEPLWL